MNPTSQSEFKLSSLLTKPKVLADQLEKLVNKAVKEIPVELEELNILKKQLNRHEDWLSRYEACI